MKKIFGRLMLVFCLIGVFVIGVGLAEANDAKIMEHRKPVYVQDVLEDDAFDDAESSVSEFGESVLLNNREALRKAFASYNEAKRSAYIERLTEELNAYVASGKMTREDVDLIIAYYDACNFLKKNDKCLDDDCKDGKRMCNPYPNEFKKESKDREFGNKFPKGVYSSMDEMSRDLMNEFQKRSSEDLKDLFDEFKDFSNRMEFSTDDYLDKYYGMNDVFRNFMNGYNFMSNMDDKIVEDKDEPEEDKDEPEEDEDGSDVFEDEYEDEYEEDTDNGSFYIRRFRDEDGNIYGYRMEWRSTAFGE